MAGARLSFPSMPVRSVWAASLLSSMEAAIFAACSLKRADPLVWAKTHAADKKNKKTAAAGLMAYHTV